MSPIMASELYDEVDLSGEVDLESSLSMGPADVADPHGSTLRAPQPCFHPRSKNGLLVGVPPASPGHDEQAPATPNARRVQRLSHAPQGLLDGKAVEVDLVGLIFGVHRPFLARGPVSATLDP